MTEVTLDEHLAKFYKTLLAAQKTDKDFDREHITQTKRFLETQLNSHCEEFGVSDKSRQLANKVIDRLFEKDCYAGFLPVGIAWWDGNWVLSWRAPYWNVEYTFGWEEQNGSFARYCKGWFTGGFTYKTGRVSKLQSRDYINEKSVLFGIQIVNFRYWSWQRWNAPSKAELEQQLWEAFI